MFKWSLLLSLLLMGICGISYSEPPKEIVIEGTGDSEALLRELGHQFETTNKNIIVTVPNSIGSSGGIKKTVEGKSDLGRIARPLKDNEVDLGLHYKLFAYIPVVFVANASVTGIDNLTSQQIVDIFSGKIKMWNELGGKNEKIYVANRELGDSCRAAIENNIPGFKDIKDPTGETLYSTQENHDALVRYKNTIGYLPLTEAKGPDLVILKVNGIYPSPENVAASKYPIVNPFGLVWKDGAKPEVLDFVNFMFSESAHKTIKSFGAIPANNTL